MAGGRKVTERLVKQMVRQMKPQQTETAGRVDADQQIYAPKSKRSTA